MKIPEFKWYTRFGERVLGPLIAASGVWIAVGGMVTKHPISIFFCLWITFWFAQPNSKGDLE